MKNQTTITTSNVSAVIGNDVVSLTVTQLAGNKQSEVSLDLSQNELRTLKLKEEITADGTEISLESGDRRAVIKGDAAHALSVKAGIQTITQMQTMPKPVGKLRRVGTTAAVFAGGMLFSLFLATMYANSEAGKNKYKEAVAAIENQTSQAETKLRPLPSELESVISNKDARQKQNMASNATVWEP